ncbi:hypothetical protein HS1genome_0593 [Sulfodiicoccus acidiphilus]|uniref:Uncharacterized protein n=1 Tax=Sulfodiicoccus acidiphilus TaxID=1670455 RepID=A0A348B202_9CREN|nr:hypothetical protein HS1genome_0593 [Sulfodiicoccus acidiphilus]GGU03062.1 hypothetical protein GCM10007116_20100 [Sulfodiicoccus acidiphilus]
MRTRLYYSTWLSALGDHICCLVLQLFKLRSLKVQINNWQIKAKNLNRHNVHREKVGIRDEEEASHF